MNDNDHLVPNNLLFIGSVLGVVIDITCPFF